MPSKTKVCVGCGCAIYSANLTGLCRACLDARNSKVQTTPTELVAADREKQRNQVALSTLKRKYDDLLKTITRQEHEIEALGALRASVDTYKIEPAKASKSSEAVRFPAWRWRRSPAAPLRWNPSDAPRR